jgi:hypothetical protein
MTKSKLTDEQIEKLRKLEKAATPGPWGVTCCEGYHYLVPPPGERMGKLSSENACFIVEARNAMPELLDIVDKLTAERETLRWLVKKTIEGMSRHDIIETPKEEGK